MRRYPLVALVSLLVLLTAAGCGGGSKKSSSSQTSTSGESTPAATTAAATKSSTTAKGGSLGNCPELAKLGTKFQAALVSANASAKGDPAKQAENAAELFDKFAGAAPSEIRNDFKVFAKALKSYASVMAKTHFTPGKQPTPAQLAALSQAARAFSAPDLAKASAHIQAWSQSHCGSAFGK
jgi:hypothetical protein